MIPSEGVGSHSVQIGRTERAVLLEVIADRQAGWERWLENPFDSSQLITFMNPYSYGIGRRSRELYERFDLIGVDGVGLCLLMGLMPHLPTPVRRSADLTSILRLILSHPGAAGKSWFLIGGESGVAAKAAGQLSGLFPGMAIAGTRPGYFESERDWDVLAQKLHRASPDMILIGMGTPLQDHAALRLRDLGVTGTIMTCGGFLTQTARNAVFYPSWMDQLHLRWLYRAITEPHVRTRLVRDYPVASALVLRDGWRSVRRPGL